MSDYEKNYAQGYASGLPTSGPGGMPHPGSLDGVRRREDEERRRKDQQTKRPAVAVYVPSNGQTAAFVAPFDHEYQTARNGAIADRERRGKLQRIVAQYSNGPQTPDEAARFKALKAQLAARETLQAACHSHLRLFDAPALTFLENALRYTPSDSNRAKLAELGRLRAEVVDFQRWLTDNGQAITRAKFAIVDKEVARQAAAERKIMRRLWSALGLVLIVGLSAFFWAIK